MSDLIEARERVQDAIVRVPKLGAAGAIYERELLEVLRLADAALESAEAKLAAVEALHTPQWVVAANVYCCPTCKVPVETEPCPTGAALGLPVGGENDGE